MLDSSYAVLSWPASFDELKHRLTTATSDYNIDGQQVPKETTYKYLGVTVSNDLSWNTHAQKIQARAARTLGVIRRALGKCD